MSQSAVEIKYWGRTLAVRGAYYDGRDPSWNGGRPYFEMEEVYFAYGGEFVPVTFLLSAEVVDEIESHALNAIAKESYCE